jgi:ribosomal protein S18 acetylase RimI-like enzyme
MDKIKCPICKEIIRNLNDLYDHLETDHIDLIPRNFSSSQYYYMLKTGKEHGSCIICKKNTRWNESTHKYNRFCDNPKCKEEYRKIFEKRMIGKHGKISLLDDPNHQRKMLANRKISGKYTWSDGTEKTYTGSYELDLLKILDNLFSFDSSDIMTPSPHTYYYEYEGEKKFYIPDMFIASLNLEIEVKDGGSNPNMHHKIQDVDKVKEKLKDQVMLSQTAFSYIKLLNKNYEPLFEFLLKKKDLFLLGEESKDKPIFIVQESSLDVVNKMVSSASKKDKNNIGPRDFYNKSKFRYVHYIQKEEVGFIEIKVYHGYAFFNIFIKKEFRGQGISKILINKGIEFCNSKNNIQKMVWTTKKDNNISIQLAKKFGFKEAPRNSKTPSKSVRFIKEIDNHEIIKEQLYMCPECGKLTSEDSKDNGCMNCPTNDLVPLNRTNKFYFELKKELGQLKYKPVGENLLESLFNNNIDSNYANLYIKLRDFLITKSSNLNPRYVHIKNANELIRNGNNNMQLVSSNRMESYEVKPTVTKLINILCQSFGFTEIQNEKVSSFSLSGEIIKLGYNHDPRIQIRIHVHSLNYDVFLYFNPNNVTIVSENLDIVKEQTINKNDLHPVYILLTYTGTGISKVIKFFTGNPYAHSSISLDTSMENIYSFGRKYKGSPGKFVKESIKDGILAGLVPDASYSLYVTFFDSDQYKLIKERIKYFEENEDSMKFSFVGLLNIAIGEETSIENERFCSQFVAEIIQAGDENRLSRDPSLYHPYDLRKIKKTYYVTRGLISKYNKELVDNKVQKIIDQL